MSAESTLGFTLGTDKESVPGQQEARSASLLSAGEWRSLGAIWFAVLATLLLTQVFRPAAGLWFVGWTVWALGHRGGYLLPVLLLAAVPVAHNVVPAGVNLSVVEVGLMVSAAGALAGWARRMGPLLPAVLAYLAICLVSMGIEFRGKDAVVSVIQTGVYLVLAVVVFHRYVRSERQLLLTALGLMGTSLLLNLMSLAQGGGGYVFGIHKNNLGATTAAATVAAMAVWLHVRQTGKPGRWTWVLVVLSVGLFMTLSRGAWAAAAVGGLTLAAVYRQWRVAGVLAVLGAVVATLGFFFLPESKQAYVLGSVDTEAHSFGTREANAEIAMDYFWQSPVVGRGVGLRKQHDATNVVLFTLAETGLVGLLAFLAIHLSATKHLMRTYRLAAPGSLTLMAAGLALALVLGRFAHGLVDHYWSRGAITTAWCMTGAALSLVAVRRSEVRAAATVNDPGAAH